MKTKLKGAKPLPACTVGPIWRIRNVFAKLANCLCANLAYVQNETTRVTLLTKRLGKVIAWCEKVISDHDRRKRYRCGRPWPCPLSRVSCQTQAKRWQPRSEQPFVVSSISRSFAVRILSIYIEKCYIVEIGQRWQREWLHLPNTGFIQDIRSLLLISISLVAC